MSERIVECHEGSPNQEAILDGYRDLAAGRVFASTGDFAADMELLERKEAEGWK